MTSASTDSSGSGSQPATAAVSKRWRFGAPAVALLLGVGLCFTEREVAWPGAFVVAAALAFVSPRSWIGSGLALATPLAALPGLGGRTTFAFLALVSAFLWVSLVMTAVLVGRVARGVLGAWAASLETSRGRGWRESALSPGSGVTLAAVVGAGIFALSDHHLFAGFPFNSLVFVVSIALALLLPEYWLEVAGLLGAPVLVSAVFSRSYLLPFEVAGAVVWFWIPFFGALLGLGWNRIHRNPMR